MSTKSKAKCSNCRRYKGLREPTNGCKACMDKYITLKYERSWKGRSYDEISVDMGPETAAVYRKVADKLKMTVEAVIEVVLTGYMIGFEMKRIMKKLSSKRVDIIEQEAIAFSGRKKS